VRPPCLKLKTRVVSFYFAVSVMLPCRTLMHCMAHGILKRFVIYKLLRRITFTHLGQAPCLVLLSESLHSFFLANNFSCSLTSLTSHERISTVLTKKARWLAVEKHLQMAHALNFLMRILRWGQVPSRETCWYRAPAPGTAPKRAELHLKHTTSTPIHL
jgi:hypothetical protein